MLVLMNLNAGVFQNKSNIIKIKKNRMVIRFARILGIFKNILGMNFKKSNDNICQGVTKHSPNVGTFGILSKLTTLLM
tara:strand:+ start:2742 stop:2975 length:234 start_codon:yes stop_codon:yes gene_type:complete